MDKEILKSYLEKLNDEQREAATLGSESAVILAAAGSGKTSTLTTRIAYLHIEKEIPLQHMLAVTFTNKAAREMRERLSKMGLKSRDLWIGTFHGICNKILQTHANEAGLKRGFTIMDTQEQETFFKRMLRSHGYDPKLVQVGYTLDQINGYKEVGWRSDRVPDNLQEKKLYRLYEEACAVDNVVDFAELMLRCYELFKNNQDLADKYSEQFEHILVDEFQDTNELQYRWLKILAAKHKNIFAVGDDDQCLIEGTKVLTALGEQEIQSLYKGNTVISNVQNYDVEKPITKTYKKEYFGLLYELTLSNGVKVTSTNTHTWFAKDAENPIFNGYGLKAKELKNGNSKIILSLSSELDKQKDTLHSLEIYPSQELVDKKMDDFFNFNPKPYLDGYIKITSTSFEHLENIKESIEAKLSEAGLSLDVSYVLESNNQLFEHVSAEKLKVGMLMIAKNGIVTLTNIRTYKVSGVHVYDIDIQDNHNFYANGVLSHNSIYGFRGARPENMNLLKKDFNAKVVKIEKNYRSEANILQLANKIILNNNNRQGKNMVPTIPAKNQILTYFALNNEEEASFIAGEIKRLRRTNIQYKDIAILYRTNSQSRALEKALNSYNIPYLVYGGFRFFDRQEVKHAMAYLRLAYEPKDNLAFLRVINTPARAIGDTTVRKLEVLAQQHKVSLFEAIDLLDVKTSKKFENFINMINHLHGQTKQKNLTKMVETVIVDSGLENMYENDKKEGPERLDNLYELISAADVYMAENPKSDITEFLAFSSLESDVNTKKRDENADAVKLMTVHASKGLEFESVFIAGLEQGLFPHANALKNKDDGAIEEERRLMYVALTRAKHNLYLSCAEERKVHGMTERYPRSMFWKEFDQTLLKRLK